MMITRYHCLTKDKIIQRAGLYVILVVSTSWMAVFAVLDGNLLGMGGIYAAPFIAAWAYVAYGVAMDFILGRIYDSYLISDSTLAIVNTKRDTRYLKASDIAAFRPHSRCFVLRDSSVLPIRNYREVNKDKPLCEYLVTRWYGDEMWERCREKKLELMWPSNRAGFGRVLLIAGTMAGGLYGVLKEYEALTTLSLIVLMPALMAPTPMEIVSARRAEIRLGTDTESRAESAGD